MPKHYLHPELRPLNQWRGNVDRIPPRLSSFATGKQVWDAGDAMSEIFNTIGRDGICDNWFAERMPHTRPVENSFSTNQIFREQDERIRFDVHLWATADMRRPVYRQVARQLREMAAFLNREAAKVDKLARRLDSGAPRKAQGAA